LLDYRGYVWSLSGLKLFVAAPIWGKIICLTHRYSVFAALQIVCAPIMSKKNLSCQAITTQSSTQVDLGFAMINEGWGFNPQNPQRQV
jgi:hypothetical protein